MSTLTGNVFTPLKLGNLTELVVSQIKNLIFSKGIEVGQKLPPERELAGRLRVSRSAVREGLKSLEYSGFIEIRRGRAAGAYVVDHLYKPFYRSTKDLLRSGKIAMRQILEARMAIECFNIRRAAERIGRDDMRRLESINDEFVTGVGDVARLVEINSRFHVALARLSGNHLTTMMLESLMRLMVDMGFSSSRPSESLRKAHRSHAAIIDALRHGDVRRCERLLASNIELSREMRAGRVDSGSRDGRGQESVKSRGHQRPGSNERKVN